jgi:hypothetical protein
MRGLERRIRKLESGLPPLLTDDVSWMYGLLWLAVAHHLGNPSPDEKPFAAFARGLGYADQSELENAMEDRYRHLLDMLRSALGPNQNGPVPVAKDRVRARFDPVDRSRDLANKLYTAEERVLTRFGIDTPSLGYSGADKKRLSEALHRIEAGFVPGSVEDSVEASEQSGVDTAAQRRPRTIHPLFRVNLAYLREITQTGAGLDPRPFSGCQDAEGACQKK